jgi:hypothetical protein
VLVELKHIDLPQEMQRAMAKQAEAERERRAKVIHADGEFQASQSLPTLPKSSANSPWRCSCVFAEPGRGGVGKEFNNDFPVPSTCSLLSEEKRPNIAILITPRYFC